MPTLPTDLQDAMQEAVIGAFGVTLRFLPMKAGEYVASVEDAARNPYEAMGTFRYEREVAERQGQTQGVTARLMGPVAEAAVQKSQFAGLLREVKAGDHLQVVDGEWPTFRIASIGEDGKGRFIFTLEKV